MERDPLSPKAKEIVEAISRDRRALLDSVESLSAEQTDFRPLSSSWSIDDVLHHLALTDEAFAKLMALFSERAAKEALGPDPTPESSALHSIDSLVEGADDLKATAPDRVNPRSKVEAKSALARLGSARGRVLQSFEALSSVDGRKLTYRHPLFGELDLYQWLLVGAWHERRHTRQIERIKNDSRFPNR